MRGDLETARAEGAACRVKARLAHNRYLLLSEDAAARAMSLSTFLSLRQHLSRADEALAVSLSARAADVARATHALGSAQAAYDNARAHLDTLLAGNLALAEEHAAALAALEETAQATGALSTQLEAKIAEREAFGAAFSAVATEAARLGEVDAALAAALARAEAEVAESGRQLAAAQNQVRATQARVAAVEQAVALAGAAMERATREVETKQALVHAALEQKGEEREALEAVERQRETIAEQVRHIPTHGFSIRTCICFLIKVNAFLIITLISFHLAVIGC